MVGRPVSGSRSTVGHLDWSVFSVRAVGGHDLCAGDVALDGEERHPAPVHAPTVHDHRLELARHARLEDALVHGGRDSDAVVDDRHRALVALPPARDVDALGVRIPGVAQHLHHDVFERADVVLGLPALGLGDLEADIPVAESLLDLDVLVAGDGGDEVQERVVGSHADQCSRAPVRA
jgi:hypothetical protein